MAKPTARLTLIRPIWLGATSLVAVASQARASDVEVSSDTAVQIYEVANPWGDGFLSRRRVLQTLGLSAYDLTGARRLGAPEYNVRMRLRIDSDVGVNDETRGIFAGGETDPSVASGARFVPGLAESQLDLMYGYLEGRNLAHGWINFRIGRQVTSDVLGFWSFDGAWVRVRTPYYVSAEAFGGFEQRGGLPLSTSRFEAQGVWRGSTLTTNDVAYPSYQRAAPAPAMGAALGMDGPLGSHARLVYRRVYDSGESTTTQFTGPDVPRSTIDGLRIASERVGATADLSRRDVGSARAGASYDVFAEHLATSYVSVDAFPNRGVIVGADADYYRASFDGDSIWNWFAHGSSTTISGRLAVDATKRLAVAGSAGTRSWNTESDSKAPSCAPATSLACTNAGATTSSSGAGIDTARDLVGNLSARYRWATSTIAFRGLVETGTRGRRDGADVALERPLAGGAYTLGTRASLYEWSDVLRPDRSATSFGYVLGLGIHPSSVASGRVEWEHDMNRLVGNRFRLLALLNVAVSR